MPTLELRAETAQDEAFLRRLYAAIRADEMALIPWPDEQKEAFLRMQFDLQRQQYRVNYTNAEFSIILVEGKPAGRCYLDRGSQDFLLIDIGLLPDYRGQGLGSQLLQTLLAEAGAQAKPVQLHVESANHRAINLYRRLGFFPVEQRGVHWLMQWQPDQIAPAPA